MLEKLIGSRSRARILAKLFTPEQPEYYLRKLAREIDLSAPVVHRELKYLMDLGLVLRLIDGSRIDFTANRAHPLYPILCDLVTRCAAFS